MSIHIDKVSLMEAGNTPYQHNWQHVRTVKHAVFLAYRVLSIVYLLFITYLFPLSASSIVIDGKTYSVDTLANFKVGPGSHYTSLRLRSNNRLDVYFLKVDATNPYVSFKAALGRDSIYSGEQPSALAKRKSMNEKVYFAGTNGDFYVTSGYIGYPVAGCIVDNEIAKPPATARKVIAFENDKTPTIGAMAFTGLVKKGDANHTIHTVNHLRETNQLVLYNQHNGKSTRTNTFGTEVLLTLVDNQKWLVNTPVKVKVFKIEKGKGNMQFMKGNAVLSGHGTAAEWLNTLTEGDELEVTLSIANGNQQLAWSQMVGGDNRNVMLLNGKVETAQVWNELHPRTAVGYSEDQKTVIFCVVDGRGASAGVTTKQLAELMLSAGAWSAFNMDGGGSSTMYVKEFGPMNVPSDGSERAVSNSLFVSSSSPYDPLVAEIKSYETTIRLPRYGVIKPRFLSYDKYGMLINKNLQGVDLSCDPSTGYINEKGEFVFSGGTNGILTGTYHQLNTNIRVEVVEEAEIFIRLDSVLVDNLKPYTIEVQSQIGLNTMTVLPSALEWTVRDTSVCIVEQGVIRGLQNGTTTIIGNMGSFNDSIQVKVEIPGAARIAHEVFADTSRWVLTSSLASWRTHFAPSDRPSGWEHGTTIRYTFQNTRSPFFKLTRSLALYGLPDTIQLVLNAGGASFSSIIMGMKTATASTTTPVSFNTLSAEGDTKLNIPLSAFTSNTSDFANFPVTLEYLTFYLNSNAHTAGQTYTVALKEIALRYKLITTSIDLSHVNKRFSIYPNPANGSILKIRGPVTEDSTIRLLSTDGKIIMQMKFTGESLEVPVENLISGTYLIQISTKGTTETHTFIRH